jgi:MoaA/NifB/PqqE/SkfB family radical SAM enzyme
MQDTVEKRVNEISRMDETITENTLPVAAKIEICGKCTLDCKFCFNHIMKTIGERQKIMDFHDFLVVLNFLKTIPTMREVGLFYMGESSLNPDMPRYYKLLKESGYFTFLTTNGTILRTVVDSIPYIDSLKVSWNYKDVKDFKRKTGHNERTYNTIIENIKAFRDVCLSTGKKLAVSTVLDGSKDEY